MKHIVVAADFPARTDSGQGDVPAPSKDAVVVRPQAISDKRKIVVADILDVERPTTRRRQFVDRRLHVDRSKVTRIRDGAGIVSVVGGGNVGERVARQFVDRRLDVGGFEVVGDVVDLGGGDRAHRACWPLRTRRSGRTYWSGWTRWTLDSLRPGRTRHSRCCSGGTDIALVTFRSCRPGRTWHRRYRPGGTGRAGRAYWPLHTLGTGRTRHGRCCSGIALIALDTLRSGGSYRPGRARHGRCCPGGTGIALSSGRSRWSNRTGHG